MHVLGNEHEYLAKGLTETALTTLWIVLTKNFLQCNVLLCHKHYLIITILSAICKASSHVKHISDRMCTHVS